MEFARADLGAIPVLRVVPRRLRLGPFESGRDLVKFLGLATVGAMVASVSSVAVWAAFLGAGALVSLVRVRNQTLDDAALGYCRFRWRSSRRSHRVRGAGVVGPGSPGRPRASPSVLAGGIPIAYLPPTELVRLFEAWRSTLDSLERPVGVRVRGERFSPLPFLPRARGADGPERDALDSYRQMVRMLLRPRYHRVVELSMADAPSEPGASDARADIGIEELVGALHRLGIPARRASLEGVREGAYPGGLP